MVSPKVKTIGPIRIELARFMAKKPNTIDGKVINYLEMFHLGKDRIQYMKIHFLDGSSIDIDPAGNEMVVKVDCSGVYDDRNLKEHEIN